MFRQCLSALALVSLLAAAPPLVIAQTTSRAAKASTTAGIETSIDYVSPRAPGSIR